MSPTPAIRKPPGRCAPSWPLTPQAEDLIRIGAYVRGSMPAIDKSIELREKILPWLRQAKNERSTFAATCAAMNHIVSGWNF